MKLIKDLFTGPDGETWAIGRIYSIPTILTGLAIPILSLMKGQDISLSEAGLGLTGVATAVTVLIYGTKGVDEGVPTTIQLTEVPSK
jgi:hypothetical protein